MERFKIKNLHNWEYTLNGGYLLANSGNGRNLSPIDGNEFAISPYIPVEEKTVYYLSGRKSERQDGTDSRVVVCYDANGNKLKPLTIDGKALPTFSIGHLNGAFMTPVGTVKLRFNSKFHSKPNTEQRIQLTKGKVEYPFIPFGQEINRDTVFISKPIPNGHIMIKNEDSFYGLDPKELHRFETRKLNNLGFPIYTTIAGTIANYQLFQVEEINQLPTKGKFICFYNNKLVFVNEGLITELA